MRDVRRARSGSKYFSTPSLAGIRERVYRISRPAASTAVRAQEKARRSGGGTVARRDGSTTMENERRERGYGRVHVAEVHALSSGQAYSAASEVTTYSICESTAYMHTTACWRSLNNLDVPATGECEQDAVCNVSI